MRVLAAFLVGFLTALVPALMIWGVWLAGAGFGNPVWIPIALVLCLGVGTTVAIAKGWLS